MGEFSAAWKLSLRSVEMARNSYSSDLCRKRNIIIDAKICHSPSRRYIQSTLANSRVIHSTVTGQIPSVQRSSDSLPRGSKTSDIRETGEENLPKRNTSKFKQKLDFDFWRGFQANSQNIFPRNSRHALRLFSLVFWKVMCQRKDTTSIWRNIWEFEVSQFTLTLCVRLPARLKLLSKMNHVFHVLQVKSQAFNRRRQRSASS